ncbi:MAG: ABC transporter permease [Geminicoccaceae bacterium]
MAPWILRRLLTLLTLLAATVVVFVVLELLPGDPAARDPRHRRARTRWPRCAPSSASIAPSSGAISPGSPSSCRAGSAELHLWCVPVARLIAERATVSVPLALIAILLSTTIAIPVGVHAASRRGRLADTLLMGVTQLGVAIPNFWFAILLIHRSSPSASAGCRPVASRAGRPASGRPCPHTHAGPRPRLAAGDDPRPPLTRSAVLDALAEDYVRTARAKGLSRGRAIWQHAVPNALIPVVTIMGLQFSFLLAGTIIIENLLPAGHPGRLTFQAIAQRDLTAVRDLVIVSRPWSSSSISWSTSSTS